MPSYGEIAQILTAFAALTTVGLSLWNRHTLKKVEQHTNGMVEKLEAAAKAQGVIQGNEESDARRDK